MATPTDDKKFGPVNDGSGAYVGGPIKRTTPTDQDREKARQVLDAPLRKVVEGMTIGDADRFAQAVAQALADERQMAYEHGFEDGRKAASGS